MQLAIIFLAPVVAYCLFLIAGQSRKSVKLPPGAQEPPGPPRKPLVGNLLDVPPFHSWLQFFQWSKTYGPLYRLDLAGQNHVIVSTERIATELLRDRGNIYSSRIHLPMATELLSHGLRPLLVPYGETFRQHRKLMATLTNITVSATYQPVQEEESLRVVRDLLRHPTGYETWFERYSAGLIMRLAYSKMVITGRESFVRRILGVVHTVERVASPGAYLADTFPILMKLPPFLAPFKREGHRLHQEEMSLFRSLLQEGITASDNMCTKWHANRDAYHLSDDQVAYVIGTLFEAGSGTTAAAMCSFLLTMTLHEHEYRLLQAEIDHVVGDRLPTFADIPNLPRVRAVAKEVLRWRPVTAGGVPHMLTQDDTYRIPDGGGEKIFLPAGTAVHANQWAIHREEKLYPQPEEFRPERWLKAGWPTFKEPLDKYPNLQNFSSFGFGRRVCPGMHIAENSLYILIARITWASVIRPKIDGKGNDIMPPSYDYVTGFNVQPKLFDFHLEPRPDKQATIEETYHTVWNSRVPTG